MTHRARRLIVSSLARVEGEGALRITVHDGQVQRAALQIYEPPRFFEAFLTSTCCTRPTSSATPTRSASPRTIGTSWNGGWS